MSKAKPDSAQSAEPEENSKAQTDNNSTETSPEQVAGAANPSGEESVEEPTEQKDPLEEAQDQANQYRDQSLRAMAELENVRRRAQRDVESARKFALEKMATELLGVRDSLEMGLQAAQQENGTLEGLKEGTELTLRMFASAMEKFSIEPINPEGESFNPDLHEAMSMQESDQHPGNTVLHVMQKGYQLNGRVLRPAMVIVSKRPQDPSDS